jgi:hypothetical protein
MRSIRGEQSRTIWYLIALTLLVMGLTACTTFNSIGWVDLPDGSRLKAMKAQSDTIVGTDTNLTLIYHCPPEGKGNCAKASEFGGSSASFLKNIFHGAAAGAAMGAGIALSDDVTTGGNVSAEATGGTAEANPRVKVDVKQYQRQDQRQHQQQQQKPSKHKYRDD